MESQIINATLIRIIYMIHKNKKYLNINNNKLRQYLQIGEYYIPIKQITNMKSIMPLLYYVHMHIRVEHEKHEYQTALY